MLDKYFPELGAQATQLADMLSNLGFSEGLAAMAGLGIAILAWAWKKWKKGKS